MARGVIADAAAGDVEDVARAAEAAGFDAVCVLETAHESIVQATLALAATTTIRVGTNVTLAFPRSPTVTAMQTWDLNGRFDDRFVVGLGSQIQRIVAERFSAPFDRPARRMAEYVQAMRTVWAMEQGDPTPFRGEFYQVLRPGVTGLGAATDRRTPEVHVAAVGPLMSRAAASHADGVLGHPLTSAAYLQGEYLPRIAEALAGAGRTEDDFKVSQAVIVAISDAPDVAIRDAKQQVGFYGTTPNYEPVLAASGDSELAHRLRAAWRQTKGHPRALARQLTDATVQTYAIAGRPDEVRERLAELETHVDQVVLSSPWYGVPAARIAENTQAILDVLAPKPAGPVPRDQGGDTRSTDTEHGGRP